MAGELELPPDFRFNPSEFPNSGDPDGTLPEDFTPSTAPASSSGGGAFTEKDWRMDYSGSSVSSKLLEAGFKRLWFEQNAINTPSTATHVIALNFSLGNQPLKSQLFQEVQKLAVDKEIQFAIVPNTGGGKVIPHHHVLYDWAFRMEGRVALLVLKTAERAILATREQKTRSHKGEISAIVSKIMSEYGVQVQGRPCQPVEWVPETQKTLIQRHLTDMEFITNELVPRSASTSNGGYVFFTIDGKNGRYQPFGTPAGSYTPPPAALIGVRELDRSFDSARRGGSTIVVEGFDMHAKKVITKTFPPGTHNPGQGDTVARVTGKSYEYLPVQQPDAVEAWAKQRFYSNAMDACPLIVTLRGQTEFNVGDTISLSKSQYREHSNYSGPVAQIKHFVSRGKYCQYVLLLSDGQTSSSGQVAPSNPDASTNVDNVQSGS
jgi:hypothetical protein